MKQWGGWLSPDGNFHQVARYGGHNDLACALTGHQSAERAERILYKRGFVKLQHDGFPYLEADDFTQAQANTLWALAAEPDLQGTSFAAMLLEGLRLAGWLQPPS